MMMRTVERGPLFTHQSNHGKFGERAGRDNGEDDDDDGNDMERARESNRVNNSHTTISK